VTPAEREIERRRKVLKRLDNRGLQSVAKSYRAVLRDLTTRLSGVTQLITRARAQGEEVSEGWLARQGRYQTLIAQHEALTLDFLRAAMATIEGVKDEAIDLAHADAPALTTAAMGPAPADALARVQSSFSRLPSDQLNRLLHNAADERPLGSLLLEVVPESTQAVKDAMASGVARGAGVRDIARDVRVASGMAQQRALLISRTEVIRAYRETSRELYERSPAVKGWLWWAEVNACPVCSAEHGSEHDLSETLDSHPSCRCTMLPVTLSWRELGYDLPDGRPALQSGSERFAGLAEADKLAIVGRARLDAYNAGEITLQDMVRETRHPRWGAGKRVATLRELELV